jgi:uncharacterized protein (DUF1697 family)
MTAKKGPRAYAGLLRGVNVGGVRLAMSDLREICTGCKLEQVQTYVQSGNVVFTSPETDSATLEAAIERGIARTLDMQIPVLVRSAADLEAVVDNSPYAHKVKDPKTLYVTFMKAAPDKAAIARVDPQPPDEFTVVGREIHLNMVGGYGRTKLSNAYFERKLKAVATTRNWRTVNTLVELLGSL